MSKSNIYTGKDGRVRIYLKETNKVISYPKFLMEEKLGRKLLPNEQIHHKDGNPLNNDIDNLELRLLGEHQKEHSTKYHDKLVKCGWCGKEFVWTAKQQSDFIRNQNRKNRTHLDSPFCSKKCIGQYGKSKQIKNK